MLIRSFEHTKPRLGEGVFIAPGAVVVGDVEVGDHSSLWYNVVVRGDIHWVRIGARCNLQDGVIVHVENQLYPTLLEDEVSVGHGAILHGCTIGRGSLVGMGAKVLNNAHIGAGCVVAAGAVVREGFNAPPGSLVAGVPAVVKRELADHEVRRAAQTASNYVEYKNRYLAEEEQ
jgi:carbonic anhydrase/acetyltransferase-like protein (isoleucine patch superfamily)